VKLSIVRGGGLLGVPIRTELSTTDLDAQRAHLLEQQIDSVRPELQERAQPPRTPDSFAYELRVDDGSTGARTARFSEQGLPESVRELISWVDTQPETHTAPDTPPNSTSA
jgi:hypothetical protein